jgi:subtilase family serine protease
LTVTAATATEAGSTKGTFTISRSVSPSVPLTVSYSISGSAVNGTDYTTIPTTATIPAGAGSVDVSIVPIDDSVLENNETVVLTLKTGGSYVIGTPSSGTVSIVSDDVAPDLVVSSLTVPETAGGGMSVSVTDGTKNQGTGQTGPSDTSFYLSINATLDTGDTLLGTRSVPDLTVGATSSSTGTLNLPDNLAPATYYVIAKADGPSTVTESNESNNTRWDSIRIGPDLAVTALSAPAAIGAGTSIAVSDTTKNLGGDSAGSSSTRFYLSTNLTWDTTDRPLEARGVIPLDAGISSSSTTTVTIPADVTTGSYYVIGRADNGGTVAEWSESNNTRSLLVRVGPDLSVSALSAPARVAAGTTITVSDTTKNVGAAPAPESSTAFHLSSNSALDADIRLSPMRVVGTLAAGALSSGSTSVMLPAVVSGSWYLIAKADDPLAVLETQENNNIRTLTLYIGPDLTVSAVTSPTTAVAGSTITVTDTVKNIGGAVSPESTTTFYLSLNTALDANDVSLSGRRTVASLEPNLTNAGQTTLTIPTGLSGRYYLLVVSDGLNAVAEAIETNNISARPITINP